MEKRGNVTQQLKKITTAIGRAMKSCKTLGVNIDDHFREVTKMITLDIRS